MNKKEFLDKLRKETSNERLVAQYDEFIDDRVADGEMEDAVVASYNLKQIVRIHELEQRAENEQTVTYSTTQSKHAIPCLIFSLVCLAVAVLCLGLVGYFIAEILEVVGGYYDHMGEAYVRSEIIGYSVALVFSIVGFIAGVIAGIISLRKYRKMKGGN